MSFEQVLEKLNSDWDFIADFLNDPGTALREANLSSDQSAALLAKDARGLMMLGASRGVVEAALSGGHSQTCG